MRGIVEQITKSKTGKSWRVLIAGEWYGAKFDSKLDQAVGKGIDFIIHADAKFGNWIETWDFDRAPALSPPPPTGTPTAHLPAPHTNGDRFYMPFVSNTVAHAIVAGLIKTPADLNLWARSAHDVAVALDAL